MTLLFKSGEDWSPQLLENIYNECEKIAIDEMELTYYPNQLEIVSAEMMLDAYSSIGLPVNYNHWSFGKDFMENWDQYKKGQTGLAYEMVINSNPCINYLMEENDATMQMLVIAHAAFGHNFVFKNNYMFKTFTDAEYIIDYMEFAKKYIAQCEEKYGIAEVEKLLDACHALRDHGVDMYIRQSKKRLSEDEQNEKARLKYDQEIRYYDDVMNKTVLKDDRAKKEKDPIELEPQENILYYIEKNAPNLKSWQREIIRIVRKVSQYFYPQAQCLTGNTLVSTDNGIIRINELIKDEGYYNKEINVLSLNNKFEKTSHFYKKKTDITIKIKTKSGKVIEGTPEHPIMVFTPDLEFKMIKLSELKNGDFIVSKLGYDNAFSKNNPKIDFINTLNVDEKTIECQICKNSYENLSTHLTQTHLTSVYEYKQKFKTDKIISGYLLSKKYKNDIKIPSEINEDLGRLFGYIFGLNINLPETHSGISFTCKNNELVSNDIINILFNNFNIKSNIDEYSLNEYGIFNVCIHNNIFNKFIRYYDVHNKKQIPSIILKSSKNVIRNFLTAFFETRSIRIGSSFEIHDYNKSLLREISYVLNNFGIISKIRFNKRKTYNDYEMFIHDGVSSPTGNVNILKIESYYMDIFKQNIGLIDKLKTEKLQKGKSASSGSPIVPYIQYHVQKLFEDLPFNPRNLIDFDKNKLKGNLPNSRNKNFNRYEIEKQIQRFESIKIHDENLYLKIKDAINDDNYYDEIIDIKINDKKKYVYDFTIPSNHLFWSNGFISHNTKVLNEGMATFTHYYIVNRLYEKGLIDDGTIKSFLISHTNVVSQPEYWKPWYSGFNPYALGFAMFRDLRRACENPTVEDKKWFPSIIGQRWQDVIKDVASNYKDDSFIQQWLSPKVMRDFKMFEIKYDQKGDAFFVEDIHDDRGYENVRSHLSESYNRINYTPNIQIVGHDKTGDRTLYLEYFPFKDRPLNEDYSEKTLKHLKWLWGYEVKLSRDASTTPSP